MNLIITLVIWTIRVKGFQGFHVEHITQLLPIDLPDLDDSPGLGLWSPVRYSSATEIAVTDQGWGCSKSLERDSLIKDSVGRS